METIMNLTGCSEEEARDALGQSGGDILFALDMLIQKPECKGDKYIPPPPKVVSGLSPEQEERCMKGRQLQEMVNAVFSVAHSKTQTQQGQAALSDEQSVVVEKTETGPV